MLVPLWGRRAREHMDRAPSVKQAPSLPSLPSAQDATLPSAPASLYLKDQDVKRHMVTALLAPIPLPHLPFSNSTQIFPVGNTIFLGAKPCVWGMTPNPSSRGGPERPKPVSSILPLSILTATRMGSHPGLNQPALAFPGPQYT